MIYKPFQPPHGAVFYSQGYKMDDNSKPVIQIIMRNMFWHPNFWNLRNFKNRLHVLMLMMLPLSCDNEKLNHKYKLAQINFWSACGDSGDYEYLKMCRKRLKEYQGKSK